MSYISSYIASVSELIRRAPEDKINAAVDAIKSAYLEGKQLFAMGNGGSGATASHIVNDFQKCIPPVGGRPYRALALTDNVPLLLAWANDSEFGNVFSEQLRNWVQLGDMVIGISGSGNSENVIRAIELANQSGAVTIGLAGFDGGRLLKTAQLCIHVPSFNMQQVEDVHMVIAHIIFSSLRESLGENKDEG
ncbi:MAG TPA: SIS domain-containing protein [Armatimonadota bacterium]|nr:SIS domain-containing protein [Armatimonadota bacterium]